MNVSLTTIVMSDDAPQSEDGEESRAAFWEKTAKRYEEESRYYQEELSKAHALLGRVIHQLSERWDSVNLTKYHPTDNLWHKRTVSNPTGKNS